MPFSVNSSMLIEQLLKLPQQKIAKTLSAILLCYIAYLCAQITWLLMPNQLTNSQHLAAGYGEQTDNTPSSSLDLTLIQRLNLFGQINEPKDVAPVKVQDAPQTKLRLTLAGAVASDDPSIAAAIIENNGKQETYGIGDKITGTRATLESVANDRVLIKQSGRLETLMLDGFKYNKSSAANTGVSRSKTKPARGKAAPIKRSANVVDQRHNKALSHSALQLKNDINKDPGKITDHLKIIPKRSQGKIIGYQLMPGRNPAFFQSSGLKSGDIAVQMNGLDLTIPSEAAQALQALKQDTELSLLVERGGEITEILFSIQ